MIKMISNKLFIDYLNGDFIDNRFELFITYSNGKYVGCDNKSGNKWVEEFDTLQNCYDWLLGKFEVVI